MKPDEAAKIVAVLFASYPHGKFDRDNAKAFVDGITDLDAQACGAAVQRLVRTSKFLPSIAEIREASTAQQHGPCARGEEAWGALMLAKRRYGYDYGESDGRRRMRDPLFYESHITKCIDLFGGWNSFALQDDDAPARARFVSMYDELARRERADLVSGQTLPASALGRGGKAALQLVQRTKGAAAVDPVLPAAAHAAPVPVRVAELRQKPGPTPFQRRMTADEIDAELQRWVTQ